MKKSSVIAIFSLFIAIFISGCSDSQFDNAETIDSPDLNGNVHFTLLQTTDMHHRAGGSGASATYSPVDGVDNSDSTDLTTGGYARIAATISEIRNAKKNKNVLLVDSGDFLMGTVYDFSLGGTLPPLAFAFIQSMGYDAITLGNHEFDFGPNPLYGFISLAMGASGTDFTVPIIASNMVTDPTDTDDDGIEALVAQEVIKTVEIKTLANGLKVGFIGLVGANAEAAAPLAKPVTFINNMTTQVTELQAIVDEVKDQVDIVIALSHSGVSNTDPANPAGDDITLAQQVTGIDIIASGHEHATTDSVLEITNGDHTTYVICAGHYGKNLAQLDVAYKVETGTIDSVSLTNNAINDSTEGDSITQTIVGMYEAGIDSVLAASDLTVHKIVGTTNSDNLSKPHQAGEAGIGNLVADSLRYVGLPTAADPAVPMLGIVANGVVRNGFTEGQMISFADLYSVLPLGMTLDDTQQNVPGYPLVKVYLTGTEIKNMCQLMSYVLAAGDASFLSSLPALSPIEAQQRGGLLQLAGGLNSGNPTDIDSYNFYVASADDALSIAAQNAFNATISGGGDNSAACQAAARVFATYALTGSDGGTLLQLVLPNLGSDYYLHVSGVQYSHAGATGNYDVVDGSVKLYANTDIQCQTEPVLTPSADNADLYPVIVDIYVVLMMQDPVFVTLLSGLDIPVVPKDSVGDPLVNVNDTSEVKATKIMSRALRQLDGTTEVKEWQALLTYLTTAGGAPYFGLGTLIPDSAYGADAIDDGFSSRVNQP